MPRFLFDASSCDIFGRHFWWPQAGCRCEGGRGHHQEGSLEFFWDPTSTASSFSTKNGLLWLPWYEEKCWSWTTRPWFRLANSLSTARVFLGTNEKTTWNLVALLRRTWHHWPSTRWPAGWTPRRILFSKFFNHIYFKWNYCSCWIVPDAGGTRWQDCEPHVADLSWLIEQNWTA